MDSFAASLFAPEKLRQVEHNAPGILAQNRSDIVEEHYIVAVRRVQGTWEATIGHDGDTFKLPGAVIDRIIAYRDRIIKEVRRDAAYGRLAKTAAADQRDASGDDQSNVVDPRDHPRPPFPLLGTE